ncbi:hypothetical protein AgCh_029629 [Apium graveolens]
MKVGSQFAEPKNKDADGCGKLERTAILKTMCAEYQETADPPICLSGDSWPDQIHGRIRPMCTLDPVYRAELCALLGGDVQGNRVGAQPVGVVLGSGVVHDSGVVGQYAGVGGVTGYGCVVLLGLQIYYLSSANIDGTGEYCERLGWKRLQDYNPAQRRWKNLNYLAQGKMVQEDTLLFEDELQDEDYFPSFLRD